ncbi:MAG TPA: zinc ribbon domain-containing protein [Gemmatimonadaceae bacterium]|jgi:putative FmdB family regulatory protein|nr:zinc ribbon domain-containing protein [Gemmatimonadaceae bacterium]
MPTYEFVCPNGHNFDKFYRKISDSASELPCPECGAMATRRISGGAGLLFKGSGFYITDYGKDGKKGMTSSPSSSNAESGTSKGSAEGTSTGGNGGSSSASTSESKSARADKSTKSE